MRGAWVALVLSAGCVHYDVTERVERGPLLRGYDREVLAQRTYAAKVELAWPSATVTATQFDVCRTERVEEYAEDRVTETTAQSVGPAVTLGVTGTAVGLGLLLARPLFSGEPDTGRIDEAGRYGPSARQRFTAIGLGALVVGVPALVVGIIGLAQSGETVETGKVEQVVDARDRRCNPKPAEGALALGRVPPRALEGGKVTFGLEDGAALAGVEGALLEGRPIELLPDEVGQLVSFGQCAAAVAAAGAPEALQALPLEALRERLFGAKRCAAVPGAPGADALKPLRDEAARRQGAE